MMEIKDIIYGNFNIEEPILIELIKSKPIQRLKKIEQNGVPQEYNEFKSYSRFDHSIGVMLLLRKLGANIEEQAAGLLHDVSHTAFSHIADLVFGHFEKEDFQDINHEKILMNSEIPLILKKHGFDAKRIVNLENYSLLESQAPNLCADRLDYSLREMHIWANPKIVNTCINSLINYNGRIIFNSKNAAKSFANSYMKCQMEYWAGIVPSIQFYIMAKMLKIALNKNIINLEDFYTTDDLIMKKLKQCNDREINEFLNILSKKIRYELSENNPEIILKKKFRYVDPEYLENEKLSRLSEEDKDYKKLLEENRRINEKGIKVNLIRN